MASSDFVGNDSGSTVRMALRQSTMRVLPQYEADDGPLSADQIRQIKKLAAVTKKKSVRSSLYQPTE